MSRCCSILSVLGKLDYLFDVLKKLGTQDSKKADEVQSEFIIESFKEALNTNQFVFATKLKHLYDFFLEEHHMFQVNATIINSIKACPFSSEIKL